MEAVGIGVQHESNPRWWIGKIDNIPALLFSLPMQLINSSKIPFVVSRLYLEGTEGWDFPEPHTIPAEDVTDTYLGVRVWPVIAKAHEILTCNAFLVDAGGHTHRLGPVAFEPPPAVVPDSSVTCTFCNQAVTVGDEPAWPSVGGSTQWP